MEVEVRFRVSAEDLERIKKLVPKGAHWISQHDQYFRHSRDTEKLGILRIRRTDEMAFLTFKGTSPLPNVWPEYETEIRDPDALKVTLLASGYQKVCCMRKSRMTFTLDGHELHLDKVEGLGYFLESEILVESRGIERSRTLQQKLKQFVRDRLLLNEEVEKGYVQMLMA